MTHSTDFGLRGRDPKTITTVVFFHHPCKDGLAAAYCVHQGLLDSESAVFLPANYSDPSWKATAEDPRQAFDAATWSLLEYREVFVADFSFPPNVLLAMAAVATLVKVFDHHESFRTRLLEHSRATNTPVHGIAPDGRDVDLKDGDKRLTRYAIVIEQVPNLSIQFSDKYCGAFLVYHAWMTRGKSSPLQRFVSYINDRDTWRWELDDSKAYHAALDLAAPQCFSTLAQFVTGDFSPQVAVGRQMLTYFDGKVAALVQDAVLIDMEVPLYKDDPQLHKVRVPVINTVGFISEVGHELLKAYPDAPFAVMWFVKTRNLRIWSLRGRDSDRVAVNIVAKHFGGGGHPKAAGFSSYSVEHVLPEPEPVVGRTP